MRESLTHPGDRLERLDDLIRAGQRGSGGHDGEHDLKASSRHDLDVRQSEIAVGEVLNLCADLLRQQCPDLCHGYRDVVRPGRDAGRTHHGHHHGIRVDTRGPRRAGFGLGFLGGDLHGEAGGEVVDPPYPEPFDRLGCEPLIDGGPLGRVEVRGRGDDLQDLVLRHLPGAEEFPHVVEPEVQVPGQVQQPPSVERGHPARHRHLGDDLPLDLLGLHVADRGQRGSPQQREFAYRRRFPRRRNILSHLCGSNDVTQLPFTCREALDHVFDSSVRTMNCEAEKGIDHGDHTVRRQVLMVSAGAQGMPEPQERGSEVVARYAQSTS